MSSSVEQEGCNIWTVSNVLELPISVKSSAVECFLDIAIIVCIYKNIIFWCVPLLVSDTILLSTKMKTKYPLKSRSTVWDKRFFLAAPRLSPDFLKPVGESWTFKTIESIKQKSKGGLQTLPTEQPGIILATSWLQTQSLYR